MYENVLIFILPFFTFSSQSLSYFKQPNLLIKEKKRKKRKWDGNLYRINEVENRSLTHLHPSQLLWPLVWIHFFSVFRSIFIFKSSIEIYSWNDKIHGKSVCMIRATSFPITQFSFTLFLYVARVNHKIIIFLYLLIFSQVFLHLPSWVVESRREDEYNGRKRNDKKCWRSFFFLFCCCAWIKWCKRRFIFFFIFSRIFHANIHWYIFECHILKSTKENAFHFYYLHEIKRMLPLIQCLH